MLYLQIASPKSSVLNFLDSNSFEVIISIFQRTEKVPDMERLLYKFPSHSLKPNPQPLKNWHSKRASPSRLTLINFGNPTKSLITRIKFYFDFNIKLHNWKLPILNRYYIRLYFRAYYAISTCILYYAAHKHSVMLSFCRKAVCCRCCCC